MPTYADTTDTKKQAVPADLAEKNSVSEHVHYLQDNRPQASIQKKQAAALANKPAAPVQKKANATGLPDNLKSGIENLSGHSMDDVKVHYNSSQPAQLNAHAYAQGTDIHVASGQEKHLPHEAWHVVQQKQGRVKPTMQMKGKVNINDDTGLEKEADVMGAKALQKKSGTTIQKKENKNTRYNRAENNNTIQLAAPGPIRHATNSCFAAALLNSFTVVQKLKELLLPANDLSADADASALQNLLLRAVNNIDATQEVPLHWVQNIMASLATNGVIANSDDAEDVNTVMMRVLHVLTAGHPDRVEGGHRLSSTIVWLGGESLINAFDRQMIPGGGPRPYPHVLHINRQLGNVALIAQTFTIPGSHGAAPVQYRLRSAIRRTADKKTGAGHFTSTIDRGAAAQEWHQSDDVGPHVAPATPLDMANVMGAGGVMYVYERTDAAAVLQLAAPMVPVGPAVDAAAQAAFSKTYTDRLKKVSTAPKTGEASKPMDFMSRLTRLKERREKRLASTPLEPLGKRREVVTPFGPVGVSKGRGSQPYVTSRIGDYDKARIPGSRYAHLEIPPDDITSEFTEQDGATGTSAKKPRAAIVRRKSAMLHGIINEAEERRFPGASKIARAALRNTSKKKRTYKDAFVQPAPDFAMAATGGAQSYHRALAGKQELTKDQQTLIENMSDSSDDDSEYSDPSDASEDYSDDYSDDSGDESESVSDSSEDESMPETLEPPAKRFKK